MRYLSLFSGIEAATVAWHPLGWEPVAFSEIEPFPCAVLEHRYPDTPNLGDVTKITEAQIKQLGPIDLVVGGSPCQAFSVAGLRKGLEDPRGNLMLEFLRVVDLAAPKYVVWENVPGVLSDKTGAFELLLTALGELGYSIDTQILDAQEFNVAQRRQRVIAVCEKLNAGPNMMWSTSKLTTLENLGKILLLTLAELSDRFQSTQKDSVLHGVSLSTLPKMMLQLGMPLETLNNLDTWIKYWNPYLKSLEGPLAASVLESKTLGLRSGQKIVLGTPTATEEPTLVSTAKKLCGIEQSLRQSLEEVWRVMNAYTTSTLTKQTIALRTYFFVETVANIAKSIIASKLPVVNSLGEDSLFLTAIQESMNYATKTNVKRAIKDAYTSMPNTEGTYASPEDLIRIAGDWASRPPILLERESLRGDTPPSRETRQAITGNAAEGTFECSGIGEYKRSSSSPLRRTGADAGGGSESIIVGERSSVTWPAEIASTLNAHFGSKQGLENQHIDSGAPLFVAGFDQNTRDEVRYINGDGQIAGALAAEPGMKQTTYLMTAAFSAGNSAEARSIGYTEEGTPPLRAADSGTNQVPTIVAAIGWSEELTAHQDLAGTLQRGGDGGRHDGVMTPELQVRRLTPKECARLQGFPDEYLDILFKGKPATDGHKYKALGNSMAVPVMRYIGERIQKAASIVDLI